jgi:pimeloyl-ACP methyl ester carboxylesterase
VLGILALALALILTLVPGLASGAATGDKAPKPTIVLIHGAFADTSGWSQVVANLQKQGYTVYAPANPLRGLPSDSDYVRSFLATIPGPIVLVGHSYGGAVITNASTGNPNIKALVYVAAFALAEGESAVDASSLGGGTSILAEHAIPRPFPGAAPGDADLYIDPAWFHRIFAQDLPASQAAVLAADQRPVTGSAFAGKSGVPGWKTIPSWYLVARDDNAIPPQAERAMAARANAHTVEINSSHAAMISHPKAVTKLILDAAHSH